MKNLLISMFMMFALCACEGESKDGKNSKGRKKNPDITVVERNFLAVQDKTLKAKLFTDEKHKFKDMKVTRKPYGPFVFNKNTGEFEYTFTDRKKDIFFKVEATRDGKTYEFVCNLTVVDDVIKDGYTSVTRIVDNEFGPGTVEKKVQALDVKKKEKVNIHLNAKAKQTSPLYITDMNKEILKTLEVKYAPHKPDGANPWSKKGGNHPVTIKVLIDKGFKKGAYQINGDEDIFFIVSE